MKIGIIGEDPYDTTAIKNLLSQKYRFRFKPILKQIKGDQLNSAKTRKLLKIETKATQYPLIIFTRDLDGLDSEEAKKEKVFQWFSQLNGIAGDCGLLLLNIYELEALILADIETFNRLYGSAIPFSGNPMFKCKPKDFLRHSTKKAKKQFTVSDNPAIFKKLRFDVLMANCPYFNDFIAAFDARLKQ